MTPVPNSTQTDRRYRVRSFSSNSHIADAILLIFCDDSSLHISNVFSDLSYLLVHYTVIHAVPVIYFPIETFRPFAAKAREAKGGERRSLRAGNGRQNGAATVVCGGEGESGGARTELFPMRGTAGGSSEETDAEADEARALAETRTLIAGLLETDLTTALQRARHAVGFSSGLRFIRRSRLVRRARRLYRTARKKLSKVCYVLSHPSLAICPIDSVFRRSLALGCRR